MLTTCFNPGCRKELHYLRTGRVVRVTRNHEGKSHVEHFWLCGECYLSHDFHFAGDGTMSMIAKKPDELLTEENLLLEDDGIEMTA